MRVPVSVGLPMHMPYASKPPPFIPFFGARCAPALMLRGCSGEREGERESRVGCTALRSNGLADTYSSLYAWKRGAIETTVRRLWASSFIGRGARFFGKHFQTHSGGPLSAVDAFWSVALRQGTIRPCYGYIAVNKAPAFTQGQ